MISNGKCSTCAYRKENHCMRKNISITIDDSCSLYANEVERCERCGVILVQPLVILDKENNVHTYCVNCYRNTNI